MLHYLDRTSYGGELKEKLLVGLRATMLISHGKLRLKSQVPESSRGFPNGGFGKSALTLSVRQIVTG